MNCARKIVLAALLWSGAWVWNAEAGPEQRQVVQEPEAAAQNGDRGTSESSGSLSTKESRRLQMNFRNVPLDVVLDYLSSSFGFIILKQADPKGNFDFQSKDALSKEQALDLVNSVIKKSGYGLISDGRILTVISLDSAKTADLEVASGSDPDRISKSEDFITQVIPVRYANATQLVNNLQLLLAP